MNTNQLRRSLAPAVQLFERVANGVQAPLLLALRLYVGWQFFETGKGKLMNLAGTTEFFAGLHIPFPAFNAALAGTVECVGGLLLLVGLATRFAAVPLIVTMIVAYLTADIEAVKNITTDPDAFIAATPFLFLLTSLLVLAFGPGAVSVDALLARRAAAATMPG